MTRPSAAGGPGGPAFVTLDGRYHVLERIAAGGMGEVFRAHDAVLAREVAVKVLHRSLASDQGFVDRFRREARAAATLNHPNIVAVYDWGAVDGVYYMVMEYVAGRSVRELLNGDHHLAPAQAADIVRQTLLALEHAHAKGIVHRDLKPENILLTSDGTVKLTDLGLARAFADARSTRGAVTGTVQYLAPEQIRGEPADPRSDLYSLGIVAYELLTGRLPFTGETPMSIAYKHLSDRVPPPSGFADDVPPDLDGFVASATDKHREMRPESALAMRRDLETIVPQLPRARSLASLVQDLPEVTKDGRPTQVAKALATETIPQVERSQRGRWRKVGIAILSTAILAAAAWGSWTYLVPHRAVVPELVGVSVDDAQAELADLGLTVNLVAGRYSMQVPRGRVLDFDPPAGIMLDRHGTVTVVPSLGPPPVKVPDVVGRVFERAGTLLVGAGLQVDEVHREYDDRVPEGSVISQDPAEGKLARGSGVDLVVSRGHAPVVVPSLDGKTKEQADAALRDQGLVPAFEEDFSDQVDRGLVLNVEGGGDEVAYGSTVVVTMSLGPEEFPAPALTGLSPSEAKDKAAEYGLEVSYFYVPNTPQTTVISQDPEAGATVIYGDTLMLFVA
jgi:serine/threonine-protein kinase